MNRLQSQPLHAGSFRTGLVFGQLLARCLGLAWLALRAASPGAHAAPVRLENAHVAVEVDAANGGLLSLHDKELLATYRMSGLGFRLETDRGTVASSQLRLDSHSSAALTLTTDAAGFAVSLHYRLGANDRFVKKLGIVILKTFPISDHRGNLHPSLKSIEQTHRTAHQSIKQMKRIISVVLSRLAAGLVLTIDFGEPIRAIIS